MVYEGNVKVLSDDGKEFTFDSPEGVAWLQMYVDMVKAGTVDNTVLTTTDDRVGLKRSSPAGSPFYASGPNLARQVKDQNATLYGNLGMVQQPLGKSNVSGKGLYVAVRQGRHEVPERRDRARPVLHQPARDGRVREARPGLPVEPPRRSRTRSSASAPAAIEDSARPLARDIIATYADIVPTIPAQGRRQRDRPQGDRVRAVRRRDTPRPPSRGGDGRQQADQVASSSSTPPAPSGGGRGTPTGHR